MATYNCATTLRESIDSMLSQTMQDFDFVICDDSSTDNTYEILQEYDCKHPGKFVILRNKVNSKLPFSLNHCLEHATGEYIARMDGDDLSKPDRLQKQCDFLDEHQEYALVGTSMTLFDENGEFGKITADQNPGPKSLLTSTPFCHATIMMRASAYKDIGGYTVAKRTVRGQDIDLWFKFFEKGYKGHNFKESLYLVRENRAAQKRRKLKFRMYEAQTRLIGYRKLGFPVYHYVYALMPILLYFIPKKLKLIVKGQNKK